MARQETIDHEASPQVLNVEKFRELLLYIATTCDDHFYFGATKLNKMLFYSDFTAFEQLGAPITGATYVALDHGPAPRQLPRIQEEMKRQGELAVREDNLHQKRLIALREPDLSKFIGTEIAVVDQVIFDLRSHTAKAVSEWFHGFLGWQAARA